MADQPTCGQGLAEHSAIPATLGELMAAMAGTLEVHTTALDPSDENARRELAAYRRLAEEQRAAAAELQAIGGEMAGYRELPMAPHDVEALSSPEAVAAFERFVAAEKALLALLQQTLERHRAMLVAMGRAAGGER